MCLRHSLQPHLSVCFTITGLWRGRLGDIHVFREHVAAEITPGAAPVSGHKQQFIPYSGSLAVTHTWGAVAATSPRHLTSKAVCCWHRRNHAQPLRTCNNLFLTAPSFHERFAASNPRLRAERCCGVFPSRNLAPSTRARSRGHTHDMHTRGSVNKSWVWLL